MSDGGQVQLRMSRPGFELDARFEIPTRGVLGVFGPSGCGKTTLLRCIAGLETGARGMVRVNGDVWQDDDKEIHVPAYAREVGYVFQDGRLFPHMSAIQNLEYGRKRSRNQGSLARNDVIALLELESLLHKKPDDLSGGEQQRVAIARALLRNPKLLLMDEPLANLDAARKSEILPFLDRLHRELLLPTLFVSHSVDEVCRLCDHVILLEQGKASAMAAIDDPRALMEQPELHAFYGTVVEGKVSGKEEPGLVLIDTEIGNLRVPGDTAVGNRVRLRIPGTDVALSLDKPERSSVLNVLESRVIRISQCDNGNRRVLLGCAQGELLAQVSEYSCRKLELAEGQMVFAMIKGLAVRSLG